MALESSLTPGQASYVIERLLIEGRVSRADIDRHLSQLPQEIREIEARLEELWAASPELEAERNVTSPVELRYRGRRSTSRRSRKTHDPGGPPAAALVPAPATTAKTRKKRRPGSPAARAKLKLQGRYVGYIRQVAPARRPMFQRLAKHLGFEVAIRALLAHLGK